MNEIKIGDVVEIVDDEYSDFGKILSKGKLAEVMDVNKHANTNHILVKELENPTIVYGRDNWWISESKVKKIEPNKNVEKVEFPRPIFNIIGNIVEERHSPLVFIPSVWGNKLIYNWNETHPSHLRITRKENFVKVNLEKDIKLVYINDKKRQVCIKWNDGTETKETCSKEDTFDFNIGFAIAFTRKFFKSDRVLDKFLDKKLVKNKKKKLKVRINTEQEKEELSKLIDNWKSCEKPLTPNERDEFAVCKPIKKDDKL